MSVLYGIWSKKSDSINENWRDQQIAANSWWHPSFTLNKTAKSVFIGGSFINLYHPQLSNADLSLEHIYIIAEARLDNRSEIFKKIAHLNQSDSDIKLIAACYLKYGTDCVHHLIGAFSFAIYDQKAAHFFCAVDHIGVKPFYYYNDDKNFVFGSQKKSIVCLPNIDKSPSWKYLVKNVLYYYHQEEDTEYKNIFRLPPGTSMLIEKDKAINLQRYWSLDETKEIFYNSDEDYEAHFIDLLSTAVKCRMRGVDTIASHLSGGLDSSGITGISAHLAPDLGKEIQAFGYTVPKNYTGELPYEDETPLIEKQANFSNIKLFPVDKRIFRTLRDVLENETKWTDGFSEMNRLNTEFEIQNAIQGEGIHVAFSGFLGDELITSFARAFYLEYLERRDFLKYFNPKIQTKVNLKERLGIAGVKVLNKLKVLNQQDTALRYHRYKHKIHPRKTLWSKHLFEESFFEKNFLNDIYENGEISEYLYGFPFTLKAYQKNHVHRRFTSMRIQGENMAGLNFHVQYRYPFADIRLLQYVLSVPVEQKIRLTQNRSLFRRSMKNYVHPDIIDRDNKFGHIKPMVSFHKEKTQYSLVKLYDDLHAQNFLPFLNHERIKSNFENDRIPPLFSLYLTYGELFNQGKFDR